MKLLYLLFWLRLAVAYVPPTRRAFLRGRVRFSDPTLRMSSTMMVPDVLDPQTQDIGLLNDTDSFIQHAFEKGDPQQQTPPTPPPPTEEQREARPFPLGMIVNHDDIKRALQLAAVNRRLGGVVLYGGRGTGKSVLARAVHRLVPSHIERVKGNRFNIDPHGTDRIDSFLQDQLEKSGQSLEDLETEMVPTPWVEVPLNCMEDSLLGTVDLERSMRTGTTVFSPGLLAKAHRGVLYVDEINLLDDEIVNILLNVVVDGQVTVEREGLSVQFPCAVNLVATYNPEEGELREHFLDRIGVALSADARLSVQERVKGVDNVIGFSAGTQEQYSALATKTLERAEKEEQEIRQQIATARTILPKVQISSPQLLYLCEESTRAGCEGQRAEIFATEIAKASAALDGRTKVNGDDLQTGVMLAIAPRSDFDLAEMASPDVDELPPPPDALPSSDLQPIPLPPDQMLEEDTTEQEQEQQQQQESEQDEEPDDEKQDLQPEDLDEIPAEFMFGVAATSIDPKLMYFNKWTRKGKGGKRSKIFNLQRGRYVKPIFPKGKKGRIAVAPTLRACAPYQKYRRARYKGTSKEGRLVIVDKDDFRIQRMARKAGSLIIFVVDASGSMALNRMDATKGAALSLLSEAYKCRDKICLISFREDKAEVIVPPTKSIALTKNRLEEMPCGGKSPMAHALILAMRTGLNALKVKQDVGRVVVVLLTDGRANVPVCTSMGEDFDTSTDPASKEGLPSRTYLKDEVMACAKQMGSLKEFNMLVIDTEDKFVGTGMAQEFATAAQGNYHHIQRSDASTVSHITKQGLEEARMR